MLPTGVQTVRRIPWTSRDLPLVSPQTQAPMLSGGSLGHPGILPLFLLRHRLHEYFVVGVFVGGIHYRVAVKKRQHGGWTSTEYLECLPTPIFPTPILPT